MGYAGGTTGDPTYDNIGDHAETIQIDFDPSVLSYGDLLKVFWSAHNPVYGGAYGQYRSMILYHSEDQRRQAEASLAEEEGIRGARFTTVIAPLREFTPAELYHQKYYLQSDRVLLKEILARYPDRQAIVDSTAAARLNGYAAGYGDLESWEKELDRLGLTEEGAAYLIKGLKEPGRKP